MGVHSFIVGINGWIFLYEYQNGFIKVAVMQHIMGEGYGIVPDQCERD